MTDATGTKPTLMLAAPLPLPAVAVMVTLPAAFAVTRPAPETVATDMLLERQSGVIPLSSWPAASVSIADSCAGSPSTIVAGAFKIWIETKTERLTTAALGTIASISCRPSFRGCPERRKRRRKAC